MKVLPLLVGVVTGAVLTHWWRPILRETIRAGIQAENKMNEVLHVVREEIQDVAAEVVEKVDGTVAEKPREHV